MLKQLDGLVARYGQIGIATYLTIFVLTLCGFAAALSLGLGASGAAETAGVWAGAYLATKLSQPIRILATVALTPVLAAIVARVRKTNPPA